MAAIQNVPYPSMVLNDRKTLVMANEAMGRLLDIENQENINEEEALIVEGLWGKTLCQMGIDLLQNGKPVWVIWDTLLEAIANETGGTEDEAQKPLPEAQESVGKAAATATAEPAEPRSGNSGKTNSNVNDTIIEVVIAPVDISGSYRKDMQQATPRHTYAKILITVWWLDQERYFTLTFTNTDTHQTPLPQGRHSRPVARAAKKRSPEPRDSRPNSRPSSLSPRHSSTYRRASIASAITSPTDLSASASPFPPLSPPSGTALSNTWSSLQKLIMMRDALLDSTQVPIVAMWKDFGLTIANRAARQLFHKCSDFCNVKDGYEFISQWHVWDETFTTRLDVSEHPISVLIRTQQPFTSRKIGIFDPVTGHKLILECSGEAMKDECTGEFLAGMITARDITDITEQIKEIKDKDDRQFQLICDSMPQMIWTSTAEGGAEWFSERWQVNRTLERGING
jgi:PAS domain-containing protein